MKEFKIILFFMNGLFFGNYLITKFFPQIPIFGDLVIGLAVAYGLYFVLSAIKYLVR